MLIYYTLIFHKICFIVTIKRLIVDKYLLFLTVAFLAINSAAYSMEQEQNNSVIRGASYCVYEGDTGITGGILMSSRFVTFYTFDGNEIKTIAHNHEPHVIEKKLDTMAPKPQPTTYQIKYWAAHQIGFGLQKGVSGNFIVFYDKNGNKINSHRYNDTASEEGDNLEQFADKFDLSIATKLPTEPRPIEKVNRCITQ